MKTLSSLLFAFGLIKGEHPDWDDATVWSKIVIIDSENGSGEMYANYPVKNSGVMVGEYNVISIAPPFTTDKYIEAIDMCEEHNMEVCIIDSMTHLWNGVGSLLEKQGNVAKRTGNSYTAWREVTPLFNRFIDKLLQCDMHVIATLRAKTEYVQEKDASGKTSVRKVGLAPVFRDGIEYEFTTFMEIDSEHQVHVTKDRTGVLDDEYFVITPREGERVAKWLASGAEMKPNEESMKVASKDNPTTSDDVSASTEELNEVIAQINSLAKTLSEAGVAKSDVASAVKKHFVVNSRPSANYNAIKDITVANAVLSELETLM